MVDSQLSQRPISAQNHHVLYFFVRAGVIADKFSGKSQLSTVVFAHKLSILAIGKLAHLRDTLETEFFSHLSVDCICNIRVGSKIIKDSFSTLSNLFIVVTEPTATLLDDALFNCHINHTAKC